MAARIFFCGAALPLVRKAHLFDGFDRLPFDKLRVCDTAGRLRMTLSRVEWVRVPSEVEGEQRSSTTQV
jgi:hypothetical protein